ncbi:MAG: hypothetical protein K8R92_08535 [Planctomycetes bacterium]|nr:hypothetical protein [Planctomycetota bacterium]
MRHGRFLFAALVLGILAACGGSVQPPAVSPPGAPRTPASAAGRPSPSVIFDLMKSRYASAKSYRDHGQWVVRVFHDGNPESRIHVVFTTAFDRGAGLKLKADEEIVGSGKAYAYFASTKNFKRFDWDYSRWPGKFKASTALGAFSEPIGETEGIVGIVPGLLMPEQDFRHIRLDPATWPNISISDAGDETVDGVECFVLDMKGWCVPEVRLWIDRSGALRMFWGVVHAQSGVMEVPAVGMVETTVQYAPEFDPIIEPAEL